MQTFENFSSLKKVTLHSSLVFLRVCAFKDWTWLEEIQIPLSIRTIAESAFYEV